MSGDEHRRTPRLAPEFELPPYSYVSGRFPHPTRDPAGHSYAHVESPPDALDASDYLASRVYLHGCDLFNHGYYWEAHEVWEGLWKASGRRGVTADFLKGLIKLAAAGVKLREGRASGLERHAKRASQLFSSVADSLQHPEYLGFDLATLVALADNLPSHVRASAAQVAPVAVVFDFVLTPRASDATG